MSMQIEALVLNSFDYQEYHKIIKVISPTHGLFSVFVGYANKGKSRYRALVEPLTKVQLYLRPPLKVDGLYTLLSGEIEDALYNIKSDFEITYLALELVDILLKSNLDDKEYLYFYRILNELLTYEILTVAKFIFGMTIFKAKLTLILGISPAIDCCVNCGSVSKIITACVTEGGLICEVCYRNTGIWLNPKDIPLYRAFFKYPLKKLLELEVSPEEIQELENWLNNYLNTYTNIKIKPRLSL